MIRYSLFLLLLYPLGFFAQNFSPLQNHIEKRDSLLRLDSLHFAGQEINLSPAEKELNKRMRAIQKAELARYKAEHFFPPARYFYHSKDHIRQHPIFKLFQQMPKGGILHLHDLAMADADWIIQKAIATPEMHVYWGEEKEGLTKGQMYAYKPGTAPQGFQTAAQLAKQIKGFEQELKSLITFDASIDGDSVDIWYEFEAIFQRVFGFSYYRPIYGDYVLQGIKNLLEDQVKHVEIRGRFDEDLYDVEGNKSSYVEVIEIIEEVYEKAKKLEADFSLSLIWANLRFMDKEIIWKDIQKALKVHKAYPHLIKGYDLVAEEDNGKPTLYHAEEFLKLNQIVAEEGLDFFLYLHDGESNWMHTDNLYDALLLDSKRLGHGFNLFRFPQLMKWVREHNVCIEVNPLSNQILGYIRDLRMHPASMYLRSGIDCTINSDDPQLFDYKGLSYDFWSVYMAWELDLAAVKSLCRNSLKHAALSKQAKERALASWEKSWNRFIQEALANWEIKN
ncbi:MAG: hypothetical protein AAF696_04175 [Bacteroidota bacterium]